MTSKNCINRYCPPPPTWRLCHPVNIYVYRNGVVGEKPQLVHIPMDKKKNMCTALEAIATRLKLSVGYPIALFNMDGSRVCKTYELDMYNNYVVVTNLEKRFKCVDYGNVRDPLVVIGHDSKHVNTLKFQNKKYDFFQRKKMARKPLHELITHEQDGLGPEDVTTGVPCGALCHKIIPRNRATLCCSDEIMCVEGAAMNVEQDQCRQLRDPCEEFEAIKEISAGPTIDDIEVNKLVQQLRKQAEESGSIGPFTPSANLISLIERYKDAGSDIFKMFTDKIAKDLEQSNISSRWNIPSHMSSETKSKLRNDMTKLTEVSCDLTFDQFGNFLQSSGCQIGPPAGGYINNPEDSLDQFSCPLVDQSEMQQTMDEMADMLILPPEGWLSEPPSPPVKATMSSSVASQDMAVQVEPGEISGPVPSLATLPELPEPPAEFLDDETETVEETFPTFLPPLPDL